MFFFQHKARVKEMRSILILCTGALILVGCGGIITVRNPYSRNLSGQCSAEVEGAELFTAATYNVGIAPGVTKQATPRIPHVAEVIAQTEFDAMCIQESWPQASTDAILRSLDLPEEQIFITETTGRNNNAGDRCSADAIQGILECARNKCSKVHPEETTRCAAKRCKSNALGLYIFHSGCLRCIIASAGLSADGIYQRCVQGKGGSRMHGGRNGLILASKYPLVNRKVVQLPSSMVNRVALIADAELPSGKRVRLACTNFSENSMIGPTHPRFSSWEDEQMAQFDAVQKIITKYDDGTPVLMMGDMGFSVGTSATLRTVNLETWKHISRNGWQSPAMHTGRHICTKCGDNHHNSADKNFLRTHILVRSQDSALRAVPQCITRFGQHERRIEGYFGKHVVTHPSPTYGLKVTFSL